MLQKLSGTVSKNNGNKKIFKSIQNMSTFKFSFNKKIGYRAAQYSEQLFSPKLWINLTSLHSRKQPLRCVPRKQFFLNFKHISSLIIGLAKCLQNTFKEIYQEGVHFQLEDCNSNPSQVILKIQLSSVQAPSLRDKSE